MDVVYHGSSTQNLERLEPRESTHGKYLYAATERAIALIYGKRCGDDLTYYIGRDKETDPWTLVERLPGAFDKMFSNSSSIYTLPGDTFKKNDTGFSAEVLSTVGVDVLSEEKIDNLYEELEKQESIKIYRYPDRPIYKPKVSEEPLYIQEDDSDIINHWRYSKNELNKSFTKNNFDRLVCLYPNLLEQANNLAKEFGLDFHYEPEDLIDLFEKGTKRQLENPDFELFIDSAYQRIGEVYSKIAMQIEPIYEKYKEDSIKAKEQVNKKMT